MERGFFSMIARTAATIAASPVGRSYAKMRNDPIIRRIAGSPLFDWVIPSTLVTVIVIAFAWLVFGPQ
jgi:hypothetical protein